MVGMFKYMEPLLKITFQKKPSLIEYYLVLQSTFLILYPQRTLFLIFNIIFNILPLVLLLLLLFVFINNNTGLEMSQLIPLTYSGRPLFHLAIPVSSFFFFFFILHIFNFHIMLLLLIIRYIDTIKQH